jgi:hypothetical protein
VKETIYIILLLAPAIANANPVLNNLDFVKYMADLSEACRSEIRIKGGKDRACGALEQEVSEMEAIIERWKSLTQEEDNEVRIYSKEKPLNLIRMRENYKKYQDNMKFIKQVN